ncbi:MAG: GNAT family N-acetyltransferase [Gemmatimonadaceae bacterium]|nr:GNAT family N-acetyltransferase [Gemmatimonadaceae bacterium]
MHPLPPDCLLRRATPADLAAYAELARRTFIETYRSSHDDVALARHVAATLDDERLRAELADAGRTVLAVTVGQEWVAYAALAAGATPPEVRGDRPLEIARFYVASAWHGRGVAAPLMDAVLDEARRRGGDAAWLCVWEHNARALRFYLGRGFELIGRTTYIFDGRPEDDHLLAIRL